MTYSFFFVVYNSYVVVRVMVSRITSSGPRVSEVVSSGRMDGISWMNCVGGSDLASDCDSVGG